MSTFKCKMCGGEIEFEQGATVGVCDSCGTKQTLPRLDDDRKANLYDRANHFRRNNDFDKAMGIYEQILAEDSTDAETYWSLVLCRYGIEYVEDPATHDRVPTVNRAQYTSIFDDDDYKSALKYADAYQRGIYEEEAKAINEIQKGILEISQKEEPFDVFISYKETDSSGRRTPDSVLANDLYHQLTQEGFKVFFSGITLEDKLGTAYEPYIFAALNSAKVMVVIGTKPEHFNAVWVKNEWSRYLALVKKSGGKKVLIPAYRDMDPYDLPEEFSHLLAQDMSKLGFMQDLIRGIKKIVQADAAPKVEVKETVVVSGGGMAVAPLLKRAFMFLEDGNWEEADKYCEKVLDQDPENVQAYLGKLMAELQVTNRKKLVDCAEPFDHKDNYNKVLRFGDEALKKEMRGYISHINDRNENARLIETYDNAVSRMNRAKSEHAYRAVADCFKSIPGFKDADTLAEQCLDKAEVCRKDEIYSSAKSNIAENSIASCEKAIQLFQSISGWKDADEQIVPCQQKIEEIRLADARKAEERRIAAKKHKKALAIGTTIVAACVAFVIILTTVIIPNSKLNSKYNAAVSFYENGEYKKAAIAFSGVGDHKDARERSFALWNDIAERQTIACSGEHTVGLKSDGTVIAAGYNTGGQCDVSDWTDVVAVACGGYHTVGLKSDGTVVAAGENRYGQCDVSDWTDVVAVACSGFRTVGLQSDGTVVAAGYNKDGQCNVSGWTDVVAIACSGDHTVGLKSDGTVVAAGDNEDGKFDVSDWTDVVAIACGRNHTVGLKSDGTVVAVGYNYSGQCDVSDWTDVVAVVCDYCQTVGLKSDGTVVAAGDNKDNQCDVSDWTDIKQPNSKR